MFLPRRIGEKIPRKADRKLLPASRFLLTKFLSSLKLSTYPIGFMKIKEELRCRGQRQCRLAKDFISRAGDQGLLHAFRIPPPLWNKVKAEQAVSSAVERKDGLL